MKTIKKLYRLQTGSLNTYQQKYGHYQGAMFYNLLHSNKCKGNVILLLLHVSTSEANMLLNQTGLPKNIKLIRTITNR
jgi:hypothetical protein